MNSFFLEFVTRDSCPLCGKGEVVARRVARILRCEVIAIQIADDDDLLRQFAMRIPVVRDPGGTVLDEGVIEFGALLKRGLLARARWAVGLRA